MQPIQQLDSRRDDLLARSPLEKAVQAGPDLISPPIETPLVGNVADIIVGQLEYVRIAERRAPLDLLAQHREELAGDTHDRHVADQEDLHPGLAFFSLLRREPLAHRAKCLDRGLCRRWVLDSFGAIGRDGPLLGRLIKVTDLDGDLFPQSVDSGDRSRLGRIERPLDGLLNAKGGFG